MNPLPAFVQATFNYVETNAAVLPTKLIFLYAAAKQLQARTTS